MVPRSPDNGPLLAHLDPGEREAIALSQQMNADYLIADDAAARSEAFQFHIRATGTLEGLAKSAHKVADVLSSLEKTSFYVAPEILKKLLAEDMRRKES